MSVGLFNLKKSSEKGKLPLANFAKSLDYVVTFPGNSSNCCIGLVDMVNSTKISAYLPKSKLAKYYEIFLNSMSKIISKYGGHVMKNIGDCLVYYFPESSAPDKKSEFLACINCGLEMKESHKKICEVLKMHDLPDVDYRISMDYGSVMIMQTNHTVSTDMIGPPINMCSKMNSLALPNQMVIGGDLYQITKDLGYAFHETKGFSIGLKQTYPVYEVSNDNLLK